LIRHYGLESASGGAILLLHRRPSLGLSGQCFDQGLRLVASVLEGGLTACFIINLFIKLQSAMGLIGPSLVSSQRSPVPPSHPEPHTHLHALRVGPDETSQRSLDTPSRAHTCSSASRATRGPTCRGRVARPILRRDGGHHNLQLTRAGPRHCNSATFKPFPL
jgi:hypothetical protein